MSIWIQNFEIKYEKAQVCYGVVKVFRNMQEAISKLELRGNTYEFSGHISYSPKLQVL